MICFLSAHRNELCVRDRRRISTHVAGQSRDRQSNRELFTLRGIDAGVAGVERERSGNPAGDDLWLAVNDRYELGGVSRLVNFWVRHARLRELIRSADPRKLRKPSFAIELREWRARENRSPV